MRLLPNVGLYKIDHLNFAPAYIVSENQGVDWGIFECDKCGYDETTLFKFR